MDEIINKCLILTSDIMSKFDSDPGHQMDHIHSVLNHINNAINCDKIFNLNSNQKLILKLATIMHDVDDHKLTDTHENLDNARFILNELKVNNEIKEKVLYIINLVSCSSNGNNNSMCEDTNNWWILWPRIADRIEAIGYIGIYRAWVYAIKKGNPMHTIDTPLPKTKKELKEILLSSDRFIKYSGKSNTFIDHFYDKLLYIANLESPEVKSNEYLFSIAKKRHQIMIDFIIDYANNEDKDQIILKYTKEY